MTDQLTLALILFGMFPLACFIGIACLILSCPDKIMKYLNDKIVVHKESIDFVHKYLEQIFTPLHNMKVNLESIATYAREANELVHEVKAEVKKETIKSFKTHNKKRMRRTITIKDLQEIRERVTAGQTHPFIYNDMGISRATYYRYIKIHKISQNT